MTAQTPERLILDGRCRALYADPLASLLKKHDVDLRSKRIRCTSNYRGYIGTWQIIDGALFLVHINWPFGEEEPFGGECRLPDRQRIALFRATSVPDFPILADWFSGTLRVALGRRLIYSHHGWSHWHERERVIAIVGGKVVRDREVDTRAMLEWWLRRYPEADDVLSGKTSAERPIAPLMWFDDTEQDTETDWWPPDYPHLTA